MQLLRKLALFPLKTGDLDVGEMTVQISASGGGIRKSEDLHVQVSEPTVQGRPPGYAVGDVGQFSLTAEISGRDIEQEGAIGVTVTLSGNGNLPASLDPPERPGVEWLDPQITEKVGAQKGDLFGGSRTFQYVVRLHRAGEVDLGDFTLPYWEPQNRVYQVARAPLGVIHVRPSATPAAAKEEAPDPLPGLPPVRTARERIAGEHRHLDDAPAFWLGLGAMPLSYGVVVAAAGTVRRVRRRRSERGMSPEAELRARVRAAEDAVASGDPRAIDAATARALEAATVAGRKLNVRRGSRTSDVARALRERGADEADATEVEAILRACDAARFSAGGAGADGASEAKLRALATGATRDRAHRRCGLVKRATFAATAVSLLPLAHTSRRARGRERERHRWRVARRDAKRAGRDGDALRKWPPRPGGGAPWRSDRRLRGARRPRRRRSGHVVRSRPRLCRARPRSGRAPGRPRSGGARVRGGGKVAHS